MKSKFTGHVCTSCSGNVIWRQLLYRVHPQSYTTVSLTRHQWPSPHFYFNCELYFAFSVSPMSYLTSLRGWRWGGFTCGKLTSHHQSCFRWHKLLSVVTFQIKKPEMGLVDGYDAGLKKWRPLLGETAVWKIELNYWCQHLFITIKMLI